MIRLRDIQRAIVDLLKSKYPTYKVYFDNVEKSNAPYFYVEMFVRSGVGDYIYFDRIVQCDIAFRSIEDKHKRVNRAELYDMSDDLERMFRPILQVGDRYITINGFEHTIIDEVLHFIFNLEFTDAFTDEEVGFVRGELVESLAFTLNNNDYTEEG